MKKCIFAGTFDPPTLGHKFLIEAGLSVFDEVIVAFLINPAKAPYFSIEERKLSIVWLTARISSVSAYVSKSAS